MTMTRKLRKIERAGVLRDRGEDVWWRNHKTGRWYRHSPGPGREFTLEDVDASWGPLTPAGIPGDPRSLAELRRDQLEVQEDFTAAERCAGR